MTDTPRPGRPREAALAMSPEHFRALGHALVDRLTAELAALPKRPVTPGETPARIRALLGAERGLPEHGEDAGALLEQAASLLFEHSVHSSHPRFHGYIAAVPAPIGVLAELLAAAVNANVALWQAAPMASEIEAQTVRWLAELVGYSKGASGLLVGGGTQANAIALQLALRTRLPQVREDGIGGARLAVYASDQTHGWLRKAVEQAGLGTRVVRWIAADAQQRLDVAVLAERIDQDLAAGVQPLMVVGSAGTVSTGAVDPLPAMAALCRRHALWFHVDGAYGAPAACLSGTPGAAALGDAGPGLLGLREADSLALDPHKWLYAPIEAGCLLVREPQRLSDTFSHRPPYYGEPATDDGPNYHELGPQNTRGLRALKVWLALRMAGRAGYQRMIADDIALAQRLFERVQATPRLEAATRQLSITSFRYRPAGLTDQAAIDALNRALLARLQRSGRAYLSQAVVDGRFLLRACVVNFHTEAAHIDALPTLVVELGDALAG